MLRLIGWAIKTSFFVLLILVLGNVIHWRGRTVSDQVKHQIANVEALGGGMPKAMTKNAKSLATEAQATRLWTRPQPAHASRSEEPEKIDPSERQKLRALIRELNNGRAGEVSGNP